ncbi:MAG: hypothetical protein GX345_08215 [Clostridiales bacterium]|nr:hypothetical protein [Clostridiales bacterium]
MKWLWITLIIIGLLLAGFFLLNSLSKNQLPSNDKDGRIPAPGQRHNFSGKNAVKTIVSKEITEFEFKSQGSFLGQDQNKRACDFCNFKLIRKNNEALCHTYGYKYDEVVFKDEFSVPISSLDDLQELVDRHELAKLNGTGGYTDGLPQDFGSTLMIKYASGEMIYASDNNTPIVPVKASLDIFNFFAALADGAGHAFDSETDTE